MKVGEIVFTRFGEWGRIKSIVGSYYEIGRGTRELKSTSFVHESEIVNPWEGVAADERVPKVRKAGWAYKSKD